MTSAYQRVVELSEGLIRANPDGVRYIDLRSHALKKIPGLNENTLTGALTRFRTNLPEGIIRPVRGLYITTDAWNARDKEKVFPGRAPRKQQAKE